MKKTLAMGVAIALLVAVTAQARTFLTPETVVSAVSFPMTPVVSEFSNQFLETLDCAHVPMSVKLSVNQAEVPPTAGNPYSGYPTTRSTQAERQAMVWQRLLVCQVDAQAVIERFVTANLASLNSNDQTVVKGKLAAASSKLSLGMLQYARKVQEVLFATPTASCCTYALADTSYPWTYPGDAAVHLNEAMKMLAKAGRTPVLSLDLERYLTRWVTQPGWADPSATTFVTNKNIYYAGTLSADARSALEATNDLHMEVADAGLACRFDETRCGEVSGLKAQLKAAEIYAASHYDLPLIAFYSQEVSPSFSDQDYCISVQRAHLAYTAWMEAVRDRGNTQEGFRDGWMASLAHSYIHQWRAMGVNLPPLIAADASSNPPGLNPGGPNNEARLPFETRKHLYAVVPGVVDGECHVHGEHIPPPPPTPRLTLSLTSDPAAQGVQAGTQAVTFATILLGTGQSAEDVSVSSIQLDLETDVGSSFPQACQLVDGTNALTTGANTLNAGGDGAQTFTLDNELALPKALQKAVKVQCDVPGGAVAGDTIEWRLSAADAVLAHGSPSGQAALVQIQASPDNQNRVTVQAPAGGSGVVDLAQLVPALRGAEFGLGPDLGEQRPPLAAHTAINIVGQAIPNTAWLTVSHGATYGDLTVAADMLDSEINGEQCGGVAALVTLGTTGRAIVARSCDAKGTDTLRLGVLDTTTGAVTALATTNLFGRIDTYGGTNPPANCDHHQAQTDYHMYCQWIRTSLTVLTNSNGTVTITATSYLRGTGLKNDPSRNDPSSPALTLIGTATWTGPRPTNVATTGKVGLVGTATQGYERISLTNLQVGP